MSALLAQAQQVQQQLMEAQEQLANTEVHGQAVDRVDRERAEEVRLAAASQVPGRA